MRNMFGMTIIVASLCVTLAHATPSATAPAPSASAHPDDIRGHYQLNDGRALTIAGTGRRILAQLEGHPDTTLVPAGGTTFAAKDGSFRLVFDQHDNGNVTGVTLEETAATPPAQVAGRH